MSAGLALGVCLACTPDGTPLGDAEGESGDGRPNAAASSGGSSGSSGPGSATGSGSEGGGSEGGGGEGGESGELPPSDGWFEMGQGEASFEALEPEGDLNLVLGGQGLFMFPMPIRGEGFDVPVPYTFGDPDTPRLTLTVDIEDYHTDFGDYFARVNRYPIEFDVLDDGSYEFIYLQVIAPNDFVDMCSVHMHQAHIEASLAVAGGGAPLIFERDMTVVSPVSPEHPCE